MRSALLLIPAVALVGVAYQGSKAPLTPDRVQAETDTILDAAVKLMETFPTDARFGGARVSFIHKRDYYYPNDPSERRLIDSWKRLEGQYDLAIGVFTNMEIDSRESGMGEEETFGRLCDGTCAPRFGHKSRQNRIRT